ncbi:MAG: hypothetical protein JO155_06395 [Acidimicrobiia bacterium]|nr:hypothetical protein [Acidimicrobiia bacterium]
MRNAPAAAVALVIVALSLGACGGGGSSSGSTPTTASAPGAKIDPNSQGVVGGPVNRAKTAVTNLNNYQQQEVDQTGG